MISSLSEAIISLIKSKTLAKYGMILRHMIKIDSSVNMIL